MSRRFKCTCTMFALDEITKRHHKVEKGSIWELVAVEAEMTTLKNVAEEGFEIYISHKSFATHFEVI